MFAAHHGNSYQATWRSGCGHEAPYEVCATAGRRAQREPRSFYLLFIIILLLIIIIRYERISAGLDRAGHAPRSRARRAGARLAQPVG